MKKTLIITLGILLVVAGAVSVGVGNVISNSKHDMRIHITNEDVNAEVCVFCHTPHGASTTTDGKLVPLWNRTDPSKNYNIYNSLTLNATPGQPSGVSLACLSCHDGSIAINTVINAPSYSLGNAFTGNIDSTGKLTNGAAYLAKDLSNDHPIAIDYMDSAESGGDPTIRPNTGATVVDSSNRTVPLFGTASPYKVECASCHAVHDPANVPFLRVANTGSQLCLICHVK